MKTGIDKIGIFKRLYGCHCRLVSQSNEDGKESKDLKVHFCEDGKILVPILNFLLSSNMT